MITDWDKIINRIKSEVGYRLGNNNSRKDQGCVSVRLTMILDCDNKPIVWTVESKRIEPGFRARELLTGEMAEALLETY